MKYVLSIFLFAQFIFAKNLLAQTNNLHGKILGQEQTTLPGASIILVGTKSGVNANETGEYRFDRVPAGKVSVQVSFVGYKTLIEEVDIKPGENTLDIILEGENIKLIGTPSWSYKTKIFFEDANTKGIEQSGYGLANFTGGIGYKNVELVFFGTNLTAEKYIVSAGNTGSLFGDPTLIPGAPRMFGTKINWKF